MKEWVERTIGHEIVEYNCNEGGKEKNKGVDLTGEVKEGVKQREVQGKDIKSKNVCKIHKPTIFSRYHIHTYISNLCNMLKELHKYVYIIFIYLIGITPQMRIIFSIKEILFKEKPSAKLGICSSGQYRRLPKQYRALALFSVGSL